MFAFNNAYNRFYRYKRQLLFLWHNDGFILISGIVGYKTHKYSNLFYLWLTVFFYTVGMNQYLKYIKCLIK